MKKCVRRDREERERISVARPRASRPCPVRHVGFSSLSVLRDQLVVGAADERKDAGGTRRSLGVRHQRRHVRVRRVRGQGEGHFRSGTRVSGTRASGVTCFRLGFQGLIQRVRWEVHEHAHAHTHTHTHTWFPEVKH